MPDNLTPKQRSYCMSRIKVRDTDIEVMLRRLLYKRGLRYRKHIRTLPGTPDVVFQRAKVAVFVDGDFWHGYQYRQLESKLSSFWKAKISKNRERDLRNFVQLRHMGWQVIRIWQHSIEKDGNAVADRIERCVRERDETRQS